MSRPQAPLRPDPQPVIDRAARAAEGPLLAALVAEAALDPAARAAIAAEAADLVRAIRAGGRPGLMEQVLAEYGLSTDEGVALMCLAEALLRVPDAETMDALIEDKIAPGDWGRHLGRSASPLVNASTWALMLTGRVLDEGGGGLAGALRGAVKRLGEPVIRRAVAGAMRALGRQFVLGETIGAAMARAAADEDRGIAMSYDMLGEAARTWEDADRYRDAYRTAIAAAGARAGIAARPGVSVKLSALHPRYEALQADRVMAELPPRLADLARQAAALGVPLTVDAEEADRLALSLDVIASVLPDPALAAWDGFGVAVQTYGRRAGAVIDRLHALAAAHGRRITVRLVKGAYWDSEVKRAQVAGLESFPVFTRKAATDVSYIALARRLLRLTDRILPQFATHNAHTMAAVLHIARAEGIPAEAFEFQRLHGMGERLHALVMARHGTRHRVYAPVGAHRDLLAYLVRRLLENGANSSFVNRIVDERVPAEAVAACPFAALAAAPAPENPAVTPGTALFAPRRNARGWDLADRGDLAALEAARAPFRHAAFAAGPVLAGPTAPRPPSPVLNPATGETVGTVAEASAADIATALAAAARWDAPPPARADALRRAADAMEADHGAILALLAREAGKTLADAVAELREAVDFLRYYAEAAGGAGRGVVACISPWNFPLAIFTGQVAAALAAGCGVIAKPAEQTPLIAARAVAHLHAAGVPRAVLQLLPGAGETVGAALTRDPRIAGVAFTGGTDTARAIRTAMAAHLDPGAPLVAETGGLNAMIVDSSALPEQAVRDILASAFQSAGQRCSALRMLYLQEEVAETVLTMLTGAMATLRIGDPWDAATDIGPVIERAAQAGIAAHVAAARAAGRVIAELPAPAGGTFAGPAVIRVGGIADLGGREVFGPVLHVATFRAADLDRVIDAVNATGYGLTFAIHSRIDARVQAAVTRVRAGNIYVNRNQIGAVVGSQPFGGEGLSGTGPKAGGPMTLLPWQAPVPAPAPGRWTGSDDPARIAAALAAAAPAAVAVAEHALPGPTGESNLLRAYPRLPVLCLGPDPEAAAAQAAAVRALGGVAVEAQGDLAPAALATLPGLSAALWWGDAETARAFAQALARRSGPILPLVTAMPGPHHATIERHVSIDTTAAGGNASLLAAAGET
jgi:RHH-type proline utilization regulon transcriptional repressor/proline dehydrogenase/delta 1-pyrroline-5-carboxylate dehydrogenase